MPLVMLCGHPCSGKSARATELISYISTHAPTTVIHLINEESLGIVRDEAYKNSITERQARGELKSAVERLLSQEHLIYCNTCEESCRSSNAGREVGQYSEACFNDLFGRLEIPNAAVKWDKPLFTVEEKEDLPAAEIFNAIFVAKAARPSLSTTPQLVSDTNFLYDMDRITQDIEKTIISSQSSIGLGCEFALPHASQKLVLTRAVRLPELRRLRQQFLKMSRVNAPKGDATHVGNVFIEYLRQIIE